MNKKVQQKLKIKKVIYNNHSMDYHNTCQRGLMQIENTQKDYFWNQINNKKIQTKTKI